MYAIILFFSIHFVFIFGVAYLDYSGICKSPRSSLNQNHVKHPEPINRRALGVFFTLLSRAFSCLQVILRIILNWL